MSATSEGPLDIQAVKARIDRDLAESSKLRGETEKFVAEQRKLMAEAMKLDRDRWLAPALAVVTVIGGFAGFISVLITALHLGR
ncbi:hypothetical protein [Rhodopila sp.]|uniref:hypothetical protein n=1 Tax=Rhodopila sp. TaxID=2480087 RepID=UPI003D12BF58